MTGTLSSIYVRDRCTRVYTTKTRFEVCLCPSKHTIFLNLNPNNGDLQSGLDNWTAEQQLGQIHLGADEFAQLNFCGSFVAAVLLQETQPQQLVDYYLKGCLSSQQRTVKTEGYTVSVRCTLVGIS